MFYPRSKMFNQDPYKYVELDLFMRKGSSGFPRSKWIYIEEHMEVYFRNSTRIIEGRVYEFVDLANLRTPEEYQAKGTLSRLMDFLYLDKKKNVYVENVMNPILAEKLITKWGFQRMAIMGYENCFYKLQPEKV